MGEGRVKPLAGKVAVVTGGSRGIGRAICLRLAVDGADVAVHYRENADQAREVAEAIEAMGSRAVAIPADLATPAGAGMLWDETVATLGPPDIVVNNAGTSEALPLAEVTLQHFEAIFHLNVRGVLFMLQQAALRLRAGGRVVNISSHLTEKGRSGSGVYMASKAAVEALTRTAALEPDFAGRGITVNAVAPGAVETDLLRERFSGPEWEAFASRSPFGRLGQPVDIADVVAFLCSKEARWITGETVRVTGGW